MSARGGEGGLREPHDKSSTRHDISPEGKEVETLPTAVDGGHVSPGNPKHGSRVRGGETCQEGQKMLK